MDRNWVSQDVKMERIFIAWESQVEMIEGGWFFTIQLSVKLQVKSKIWIKPPTSRVRFALNPLLNFRAVSLYLSHSGHDSWGQWPLEGSNMVSILYIIFKKYLHKYSWSLNIYNYIRSYCFVYLLQNLFSLIYLVKLEWRVTFVYISLLMGDWVFCIISSMLHCIIESNSGDL